MRLKQLLGMVVLLVGSVVAVGATSQLTNISVGAQGSATVITLRTNGAFTHAEYRPTDTLLLIDLNGVSAGNWNEKARSLQMPGVNAYHVLEYTGSSGSSVARVELAITPGAVVNVTPAAGALLVSIAPDAASAANLQANPPVLVAARAPATAARPAQPPVRFGDGMAVVRSISVVRGADGLQVEIGASRAITPRTMTLSGPERIVVDLPDAVPQGRGRVIRVGTDDVKSVRMAQFQTNPPVTRVVVDLSAPKQFEVTSSNGKLVVKLRGANTSATGAAESGAKPSGPTRAPVAAAGAADAPHKVEATTPSPVMVAALDRSSVVVPSGSMRNPETTGPAKDFVMLEPTYKPAPAKPAVDPKAAAAAAAQVIASAAPMQQMQSSADTNGAPQPESQGAGAQPPAQDQPSTQAPASQVMPQPGTSTVTGASRPKYTGEPISVNLKDVDLKDFFRLIHEISGLNIVLDPNVRGTLTLVLDDVPWDQALDIVLQNNGLDRKLEGNVLRIATLETRRREAEAMRAKNEAEALSVPKISVTHFLSYAKAADVLPTVKKFLSQRGDVIADARTNALIIQDIPSVIPAVQALLNQLDRKTLEVEIEARVVAATRSFARDIGFQLAFAWGNNPSAVGGSSKVGDSPVQVGYPSPPPYIVTAGGNGTIPLFSNLTPTKPTSGLTFLNLGSAYRLDVMLQMAEERGLLKILSRPRVVTQNNILALVRQGLRVPVVTQAQLGGPPTVSYVDAFLRLTVTPQITSERTIFLNLDVENTTPDFGRTVQGNPTLITQQATTSVLVSDGGTVVIGGVIQTQNSVNVRQVPLLGDIPVLGNLFKERAVSTSTQELLFFVTPKIVQT